MTDHHVADLVVAANRIGARPFKDATGSWAQNVEVALMDTILSIGAVQEGNYGAGVLPRLRAFKAFRGPANMMRVIATLGPFGLADFVSQEDHLDQIMGAAGSLLDTGIQSAADVDPTSETQRAALISTSGVPELAWEYFISSLDLTTGHTGSVQQQWLTNFVARATGEPALDSTQRDAALRQATELLDVEHEKKSFGRMPTFTLAQLHQAIFRAEYARTTAV